MHLSNEASARTGLRVHPEAHPFRPRRKHFVVEFPLIFRLKLEQRSVAKQEGGAGRGKHHARFFISHVITNFRAFPCGLGGWTPWGGVGSSEQVKAKVKGSAAGKHMILGSMALMVVAAVFGALDKYICMYGDVDVGVEVGALEHVSCVDAGL